MQYRYVGQPLADGTHDVHVSGKCEMAGIVFPVGVPVEVGAKLAADLAGNNHFEAVADEPAPAPVLEDVSAPEPDLEHFSKSHKRGKKR